jgi:NAD(P)-dependent dehydrogenase (short-subunit alcohol dehydrogenase family)
MIDKRVVIITGGAGGIGGACAKKFIQENDAVVLVDVNETVGEERAESFRSEGKEAIFLKTDVTNYQNCVMLIKTVMEKYGRIDVLHNNAGILGKTRNFLEMDVAEFRNVMDVNLVAAFQLSKLAAIEMIAGGNGGVIINTSSLAAFQPNHEPVCYPISKAAISMLTQATARELGGKGVRVVAVGPGWVRSIVTGGAIENPFERPEIKELHMSNRVVEPEEVADVVYFLSTPAASGINGTTVMVDDGYTSFKLQTSLV